jgi:hypothetical protein
VPCLGVCVPWQVVHLAARWSSLARSASVQDIKQFGWHSVLALAWKLVVMHIGFGFHLYWRAHVSGTS